ncbi:MAG: toxin-activating lysine-acyltransferase [Pseudomonadota bacterium]
MKDLYDAAGQRLPDRETPSAERLRAYGDLMFLAFRSERHRQMSTATLQTYLEPPLELGQYRIFRFDDVPRGMYTWAWLDRSGERRLIRGDPLAPEDWRSGERLWIIDLIAPYRGMTKSMVRFIMTPGNFTDKEFWFRRTRGVNDTQRILHVNFRDRKLAHVLRDSDFLPGRRRP